MYKLHDVFLPRLVRAETGLRARMEDLRSNPESGLEDAPWKAIFIVGGAVLGLAIVAGITAWVNGYIAKLPG